MYKHKRVGALLLMAGKGCRFQSDTPKQFHLLKGKKLYLHTLEVFLKIGLFDEILLVVSKESLDAVREETAHLASVRIVLGGATRQLSSFLGLKSFLTPPDIVSIHDAVRPFVTEEVLLANLEGALQYGAVNTCIPSTDTLVFSSDLQTIEAIPERKNFLKGQTPQTFCYKTIFEAHKEAEKNTIENATDDCQLLLRMGKKIFIAPGSEKNLKITSQFDLFLAEFILSYK